MEKSKIKSLKFFFVKKKKPESWHLNAAVQVLAHPSRLLSGDVELLPQDATQFEATCWNVRSVQQHKLLGWFQVADGLKLLKSSGSLLSSWNDAAGNWWQMRRTKQSERLSTVTSLLFSSCISSSNTLKPKLAPVELTFFWKLVADCWLEKTNECISVASKPGVRTGHTSGDERIWLGAWLMFTSGSRPTTSPRRQAPKLTQRIKSSSDDGEEGVDNK